MLKDEPEDLTHLAPTAGDACVPLDLPQLSDMFDDFLNDNYCPLLNTDELNSLSDSQSSWNSRASGDPFFSYRDDSDSAGSPSDLNGRMKSPCFTKVCVTKSDEVDSSFIPATSIGQWSDVTSHQTVRNMWKTF